MRLRGNEYRTTMICIDSYEQGVPKGRFFNPCMQEDQSFKSMVQLLTRIEQTLDEMNLPQSFTAMRSFVSLPEQRTSGPPDSGPQHGRLATFAVNILFRQNASWQGSVTWLEGKCEQSFRSVLELILSMDSALCNEDNEPETNHLPTAI